MTTLSSSTLRFTNLLLLSAGLAAAQNVSTLTVDGQPCGVQQWSFSVTDSTATTSASGKASLSNLLLTRAEDSCSAQFFKSSLTGTHADKVILRQMDPTGKVVILSIELDTVPVANYQLSGQITGGLVESIALAFQQVTITYYSRNPDGTQGPPTQVGWDVARNMFL
jgi:type VI protein secretion system component Hcp